MTRNSPEGKLKYLITVLFFYAFIAPGYSGIFQVSDTGQKNSANSVLYTKKTFKAEEIIRGERLFYGLAYLKNESVNCASCHNTRVSDHLKESRCPGNF